MVEIPSCQNDGWKADVETCKVVGFDCGREYNGRYAAKRNVAKNVFQKSSQRGIKKRTDVPRTFVAEFKRENISKDDRAKDIFKMCLEPDDLCDRLSLTSPKNFVVRYFTVSRNQPVKVCGGSECPLAGQGPRTQDSEVEPACPELPRCKRSRTENPERSNPLNKIQRAGNPDEGDDRSSQECGSAVRSSKNTPQQTDPELSWQERCSNFVTNLPATLSEKLFGPRMTCNELNDCKRTILDDDSKPNTSQPVPEDSCGLGSRDRSNDKSAKLQASTSANLGCRKTISSDRGCLGKANRVDPCHSRTLHAVQEDVPCGRSPQGSEKVTSKCRKSDPVQPRFERGAKRSTSSSVPEKNKRRKTSPIFSNWSAILSEKFFGPRTEKVSRPCSEAIKGVVDSPEIVCVADSPPAEKKERLLLKKYTISKTPEAMEETLCFDILDKEDPTASGAKMRSKVCVKFTSDDQQKLGTVKKRCVKSRGNYSGPSSRRIEHLEKKTSTEHIFLSSLIRKLLNKHKDDKDAGNGKNCQRKTTNERDTVSRKYATTSIREQKNKPVMVGDGRKSGADLCSLEPKVSLDRCTPDFPDVLADKDKTEREIEGNLENVRGLSEKVPRVITDDCTNGSEHKSRNLSGEYQECSGRESSKAKDLVKSGVLQVIDKSFGREPRGPRSFHERKREPKLTVREKYCKKVSSPNKFTSRARRRYRVENNDSHLVSRGCFGGDPSAQQRGTTEAGICGIIEESEASTPEKYGVIIVQGGNSRRKQCRGEEFTVGKVCERLIVKGNEISDQFLKEGPRRTCVIAGDNICVKMLYDRETFTDDLPGSGCRQSSEFLDEKPGQGIPRSTPVRNIEKVKKSSPPPSHKPGQSCITDRTQSRQPQGYYPRSKSSGESPMSEVNGNGSMQKQPENATGMKVGCEECVGSRCKDNASRVHPGGISKDDGVLGPEQSVGKVFSPLCKETFEEGANKVCGSEPYPCEASIQSETEEALTVSKKDNKKDTESRDSETEGTDNNRQSLNHYPGKGERSDEVEPNIDSSEKGEISTKSSGKNLSVTKPESRNIINSYYSQRKNDVFPRSEVRNDEHRQMKKGKVQRNGGEADKSITKARKPFQRIENVRQASRAASVAIKDDGGKKRVVEKENSIMNKKAQSNQDGGVFDNEAKNYLVQNLAVDDFTLPGVPSDSHPSSMQEFDKPDAVSPKAQTTASKIPRISGLLARSEPPTGAPVSAVQAAKSPGAKLKENFRRNWLKKGNSSAASGKTDAKGTRGEAGKIAESESSNRPTGSIDTCDATGRKTHEELQIPAYISDEENVKARTFQIQMASIEKRIIENGDIVKGTSRVANSRESSESSKSPSRQEDGKRKEDDRSRNGKGGRERKENMQAKEDQSKSLTASKKNEKDKKSTPFKISSQNDTEIDASSSTQGSARTNADLFDSALMDGKNNIQSYGDLQSAAPENSNANQISTPKDERLQKSGTATARSKPKLLTPSKSRKASPRVTHKVTKIERKPRSSDEGAGKITKTFHIADRDRTKKAPSTSIANTDSKNDGEKRKDDAEVNEANVTRDSSNIGVNSDGNRQSDVQPGTNSKEVEHLEEPQSPASKDDLRQNSVAPADCTFEKSCRAQTAENRVPSKNTAIEGASVCTPSKGPNHESFSCRFRVPTHRTKNVTPKSSSRAGSDSNGKRKQPACRNILLPRKPPPCKPREDKDLSKSKCRGKATKDLESTEQQVIDCSKVGEAITDIGESRMPTVECKKSVDPRCDGTVSRILSKGNDNTEEKEIMHQEYDDVPEKLTTICDSGRSSNDSTEKNFSFTDDLKRFLDQAQEFFASKRKSNCADCGERLNKSSKISDEERASNNSFSSLQKAYSALKTMLNKTKNTQHKGFMYTNRTKGTQICAPTLYESDSLIEDCDKSRGGGRSLGSKTSESNESLILSVSFGSSIFGDLNSPACDKEHTKL